MGRLKLLGLDAFVAIVGLGVTALVISVLVNIPVFRSAILPQQVASTVEVSSNPVGYPDATDIFQVEIRNGVGVQGAAEQMRDYLRSKGYDVVAVGNHHSFDVDKTTIVDRIGNLEITSQVAASLGLSPDRIQEDVRTEFHLDASIIIGKDYGMIPPFTQQSGTTQESNLNDTN